MAHGAPDASDVVLIGQDYRLDDMAELAARLGSVMTYQRRGTLFFADTFVGGLGGWFVTTDAPASTILLQNTMVLSDAVGVCFHTRAAAGAVAILSRFVPSTNTGRVGLSFGFDIGDNVEGFGFVFRSYRAPWQNYGEI